MSEERSKPHPLQRAWAAGVFDARGTIPKTGFVIRFEAVDEPMMKRFSETIGFGRFTSRDKKAVPRPIWVFETINMDDSRDLLLLMAPFLSTIKTKQAAELIARIERNTKWKKDNPEKASASVTVPVETKTVDHQTPPPSTTQAGFTASHVEPTTKLAEVTPLD